MSGLSAILFQHSELVIAIWFALGILGSFKGWPRWLAIALGVCFWVEIIRSSPRYVFMLRNYDDDGATWILIAAATLAFAGHHARKAVLNRESAGLTPLVRWAHNLSLVAIFVAIALTTILVWVAATGLERRAGDPWLPAIEGSGLDLAMGMLGGSTLDNLFHLGRSQSYNFSLLMLLYASNARAFDLLVRHPVLLIMGAVSSIGAAAGGVYTLLMLRDTLRGEEHLTLVIWAVGLATCVASYRILAWIVPTTIERIMRHRGIQTSQRAR